MSARARIHAMFPLDEQAERELDVRLDAHRAEVLAADGQAYDGELAMYRHLVRTLRVVARPDDADMSEVRRLLHQHAGDDAAARTEKATVTAATATPDFFHPGHTYTEDAPFRAPEDRPNFQCVAVAVHPTTGTRRALGFEQPGAGAPWRSSSMRDEEWAGGWVDVTEGG